MGRGLAAILPRTEEPADTGLRSLAIEVIGSNPNQPRKEFDPEALTALSESIRSRGLLQPIVVRPLAGGRYELIAGERRLRAAKAAGLEEIPALVRPTEDDERLELALMENVARDDLNPVEEARACATLVEDLGVTKEELARRIGKSRAAVSNLIRILALPDEVLALLEQGSLTEGHGRALLVAKDQRRRLLLAREAVSRDWSVRETERHAKGEADPPAAGPRSHGGTVSIHPDLADALAAAEDALTAALGREVRVKATREGCRVELDLGHPQEGIELAERLLRRAAAA
jgi:ParB family chromosome partitioning protein